jgi:hypothetical protein
MSAPEDIWKVQVTGETLTNQAEVRAALSVLIDPDASHEIRTLPSKFSRTIHGDRPGEAVATVEGLGKEKGIYVTLNPVPRDFTGAAKMQNITKRRRLLIDIDPTRHVSDSEKGTTSSSEAEKDAAGVLAMTIMDHLSGLGFPKPVMIDSGNGWHLVYMIDMLNDVHAAKTVKAFLEVLAKQFDNEDATVDVGVANANRITKLPGTWVRKGLSTPERPHRMSRLVSVPAAYTDVPTDLIEAVAGTIRSDEEPPRDHRGRFAMTVPREHDTALENYVRSAVTLECDRVAYAQHGTRNNALNTAAFCLGQLVHFNVASRRDIEQILTAVAVGAGLTEKETEATIKSGLDAGEKEPRDRTEASDAKSVRLDDKAPDRDLKKNVDGSKVYGETAEKHHKSADPEGLNVLKILNVPGVVIIPEDEWEPPVLEKAHGVEPFPLHVFPDALANLCRVGSQAFRCPVDYLAVSAVGLLGGVIGRSVALKMTPTWEVTPNLFVAVVGGPGSKKSPALKFMAGPLYRIDRELRDIYKEAKEAWKRLGDDEADEPVMGHLTLDDTTREAFSKILNDNPRGLVLVKDELTAWVADLNAYRGGKGSDKQFWMSLNTGTLIKVTRKGSPEPLVIVHPCGAVVGCLTPSTLPQVKESGADDGWIDRMLFTFPPPSEWPAEWVRSEIPTELTDDWSAAVDRLWSRQMVREGESKHPRPYFIHFGKGAEAAWAEFFRHHQQEQKSDDFPGSLAGPWSKYEGYTLRLAVILSQLRQAYDPTDDGPPSDVTGVDVKHAVALITYFKSQFRRVRDELAGSTGVLTPDAESVLSWLKDDGRESFTSTELRRKFRKFDDRDRAGAIASLAACKVIRSAILPRSDGLPQGRKAIGYEVNPWVHSADGPRPKTPEPELKPDQSELSGRALQYLVAYLVQGAAPKAEVIEKALRHDIPEADLIPASLKLNVITFMKDGVEMWEMT